MSSTTHEAVILYSQDGYDELMRVPIERIASCSRGLLRRSLVIKIMINVEENTVKYLSKVQKEADEMVAKIQSPGRQLTKDDHDKLKARYEDMCKRIKLLITNPAELEKVKRRQADIAKKTFRLTKNHSTESASEEYKIWEYA